MKNFDLSSSFHVAIVGRPNVGKSTLWNRLVGKKRALVHNQPGVTRDRLEGRVEWLVQKQTFPITFIDTGGLGGDSFSIEIQKQVQIALENANLVLFVLDGQSGFTPFDQELYLKFKKSGQMDRIPFLGVINKVDIEQHESRMQDFYQPQLQFFSLLTLSAEHNRGIEDLKQVILEQLASLTLPESSQRIEKSLARIAIVGKPNVGKSTLVNTLLGTHRMITSPIAGTTSDSVDTLAYCNGKLFTWIDTAGIRRKSKTHQGLEVLSVVQTRKMLEHSDIAILLLDGQEGLSDQDEKIGGLLEEAGCSILLMVNKWDTQKQNQKFTQKIAAENIRRQMAYLKYAPLLFVSALHGQGLKSLGNELESILYQRHLKISAHDLTQWVKHQATVHNPKQAKFYFCHQLSSQPPTFVCHVNDPEKIDFSLKRHLVNSIRKRWGYSGSPIRIVFSQR